ncbi:GerMN domain-containing protein [Brucepastera parasyntrophica]|uniref:GerMN domain-containing protein n=1 Tax=Brucepastera parasyntrophica TaxID=2880008 RepID=UPI0021088924|nr:GerMN domain-containing protein [Brucepastera parasyntrophica]ULQ58474.1 GerMN domain-containing protein [Brucepastera parasyntrophica]
MFWIAFILLVLVLFLLNRKNISTVLEKTGAGDMLFGKKHTEATDTGPRIPPIQTNDDITLVPAGGDGSGAAPEQPAPSGDITVVSQPEQPASQGTNTQAPAEQPQTAAPVQPQVKPPQEVPQATRKTTLFFVSIDADGRVVRHEVTREIPQTDSPLTETLRVLFQGTNAAEAKRGLRSLIPQGTRLLSASVRDGVARLNVSEEFQFNQFGIEGYLGQLAQIVYTATAFPTVNSVQFLIEGQQREYLGAEGVWIGTPLTRDKF